MCPRPQMTLPWFNPKSHGNKIALFCNMSRGKRQPFLELSMVQENDTMQLQKTSNFGSILTAMLDKIAKVQASPTEILTVANISPAPEPASTVTVPPIGQPVPVPVAQAWVRRNCKFADIMDKNPPEELQQNVQDPLEIKKQIELEQQLKKQQPQLEKPVTEQKALIRKINRDPNLTPLINTMGQHELGAVYELDKAFIKNPEILPQLINRTKQEHKKEYPDNIPAIPIAKTLGKTPIQKDVQEQLKIQKP